LRFFADENVKAPIVQRLRSDGQDVFYVNDKENNLDEATKLKGREDSYQGKLATEQGRVVLTNDIHTFRHENFEKGQFLPNGIIGLRLNQVNPETQANRVSDYIKNTPPEKIQGHQTMIEPATERVKTMEQAQQNWEQTQTSNTQQTNIDIEIDR
jgi:hypothetical protein